MKKTAIITLTVLAVIAATVTAFAMASATKTTAEVSSDSVSNIDVEKEEIEFTTELIEIETENDPADEETIETVFEITEPETVEEIVEEEIEEEIEEATAPEMIIAEKPVIRSLEIKAPAAKSAPAQAKAAADEEQTVTVRFNANGGSVTTKGRTLTAGKAYGNLPVPSHSGHNFLGWFTSPEGGEQVTARTTVPAKDHTLYARWSASKTIEEPECTVTVHFVSSVPANKMPEDMEVVYGSTYSELVALKDVDGYHFVGWYTADGRYIQKTSIVETGEDHILYARWEEVA